MRSIALVPARGGSRRIPRKNVRPFLGEPAVARIVRTIRESGIVTRIVVSTDDDEVASIARASGAEVPDHRPADLADDHATTIAVVRHAIRAWLSEEPPTAPLWVVYPTALLIRPDDLRSSAERFAAADAEFLVPLLRFPHPIERRLRLRTDGLIRPDEAEQLAVRSQDLEPSFHDAGQHYVGRIRSWLTSSPLSDPRSLGIELARDRAVDIDEPAHWALAEALAEAQGLD